MEDESALRSSETEGFPEQSVRKHSLKRTRAGLPGGGGFVLFVGLEPKILPLKNISRTKFFLVQENREYKG